MATQSPRRRTVASATDAKRRAVETVDGAAHHLVTLSHTMHARPELAFQEHESAAVLADALQRAGFDVTMGVGGLATAFVASAGNPDGPAVFVCCEYDALPELGHACGHNVIGAAGVGAGLALLPLAERLGGRVVVIGTPAEEGGGGKAILADHGLFDGAAAVMLVHPSNSDVAAPVFRAAATVDVRFRGRAAHAAMAPEHGRNALDAAVTSYGSIAHLRSRLSAGDAVSMTFGTSAPPNVVPDRADGAVMARSPTSRGLTSILDNVRTCCASGAAAAGCTWSLSPRGPTYREMRSSAPLASAFAANAKRLGRPMGCGSSKAARAGSTDLGNVSLLAPTIHPMFAIAPRTVGLHTPAFARAAVGEAADRGLIDASKAMAMTAIDVWSSRELRQQLHRSRNHQEES